MVNKLIGFTEIAHTADLALKVWAPDIAGLLKISARGMYALMGVEIEPDEEDIRELLIAQDDIESMLVDYLNELLYYCENGIAYDLISCALDEKGLVVRLKGSKLITIARMIKAATFHRLAIQRTDSGLATDIVFDV